MAGRTRTTDFLLRLNETERKVLKQEANRHALSESEYLRRLILGAHASQVIVPMILPRPSL